MRKKVISFGLIAVFVLLLWHGGINYEQSLHALSLWFETLVPSLFCVMVLVKVMFSSGTLDFIAKPFTFLCEPLFHISKQSFSYVIALMFLGFPAGAAFINTAVREGHLSEAEGRRLLSTCSFATPGFVIMTVGSLLFDDVRTGISLFFIQLLSGIILLLATRRQPINGIRKYDNQRGFISTIANAMTDSGKALYMMGGYLMLCMSISGVILRYFPNDLQLPLTIISEFSSGCVTLSKLTIPLECKLIFISMLLSFGGFCVHMQVMCMSEQTAMHYGKYFCFRMAQALISAVLAYLFFVL